MKRVTTLAEIHQSCDPRPLRRDELSQFYIDAADARDPVLSRREEIRKRLVRDVNTHTKLLLAGHSGCGKSTELVKLSDEIIDTFFTVNFSVAQECNFRTPDTATPKPGRFLHRLVFETHVNADKTTGLGRYNRSRLLKPSDAPQSQ